jgi:hypothetical protein
MKRMDRQAALPKLGLRSLALGSLFGTLVAACDARPGDTSPGTGGSAGAGAAEAGSTSGQGGSGAGSGGLGGGVGGLGGGPTGVGGGCESQAPPLLDSPVPPPVMTAAFQPHYQVYDLGPVPGMPAGHLGGCVVLHNDSSTLLLAGDSEAQTGGLYSIGLKRDGCGHVLGFEGTAKHIATTPYIDANLLYGKENVLLYSQWPVNQISQLLPAASSPAMTTDLAPFGVDSSAGGMGFVPPGFASEGTLRAVTWSAGNWFRLGATFENGLYNITQATLATNLPNGPGGFAYVPVNSPGFPVQSVIVAEWSGDKVAVYEVDDQADPKAGTRKEFFSFFQKPWGAYFEPLSGDYLFLTWGPSPDRVYVIRGFAPPPDPPK